MQALSTASYCAVGKDFGATRPEEAFAKLRSEHIMLRPKSYYDHLVITAACEPQLSAEWTTYRCWRDSTERWVQLNSQKVRDLLTPRLYLQVSHIALGPYIYISQCVIMLNNSYPCDVVQQRHLWLVGSDFRQIQKRAESKSSSISTRRPLSKRHWNALRFVVWKNSTLPIGLDAVGYYYL